MKLTKIFALILAILAIPAVLISCDNGGNVEITLPADTDNSGTARDDVFCFTVGDISIAPGDNLTEIIEKLGGYVSYEEFDNCAGIGKSKFYHYSDYVLSTYTEYNTDYCNTIQISGGSIAKTAEGLGLNDTLESMISIYGNSYTESYGVYTYTKKNTSLLIKIENNTVTEIEYIAVH